MEIKLTKIVYIIEIVLLIGITLSSIFIQRIDNKINDYQYVVIERMTALNGYKNLGLQYSIDKFENNFFIALKLSPEYPKDKIFSKYVDSDFQKIIEDYMNKKISSEEFLSKESIFLNKKIDESNDLYNSSQEIINKQLKQGPTCLGNNCMKIVNWLYTLQIICIVISLFIYLYLIKHTEKSFQTKSKKIIDKKIINILINFVRNPRVFFWRKLNFFFTKLKLNKLLVNKDYLISYAGGRIFLNLKESSMMRGRALGIYEYKKVKLLEKLIKPGLTILDVGVNSGYFTLLAAKLMQDQGQILVFEPAPENYQRVKKTLAYNRYQSISLWPLALFNRNGQLSLFKGVESGCHSLIKDSGLGSWPVITKKLDDFIFEQNIKKVDLIKIDVEGAEIEVLEGARKLLNEQHPQLIIDLHQIDRKKFYQLLTDFGYQIFSYTLKNINPLTEAEFLNKNYLEIYAQKKS